MADPISAAIDQVEAILGHSPHPAVVTVPIGAWTVSNICDGLGMASGADKFDDAARLSLGIGLVGAAAAAITGIRDYSKIPKDRPSHEIATTHALGNAVAGSLMAASFILRVRDHAEGRRTGNLARVIGLAGGGLSLWTAWLGGKLVEEYGEGVKPVMDHMDDHAQGRERLSPGAPLGLHSA